MPLEPPAALAAAQITFRLSDTQSESRSPFTRTSERFDWGRQIWLAEVRFSRRQAAAAAALRGFLARLGGTRETFWLGDPAAAAPQGTQAADFMLASGAAPGDVTLAVTMGAGATLKAGDYLQLGERLHLMTGDATADGSGAATLPIWPAVRDTQSPGAIVRSTNARGAWRLADPDRSYAVAPAGFYTVALNLVEAI
jgi:hypothetical protein